MVSEARESLKHKDQNTSLEEKVAVKEISSFKNMDSVYKWIQKFNKRGTLFHLCCLSLLGALGSSSIIAVHL